MFDFLKEREGGVLVQIKVRPRAKKDGPLKFDFEQPELSWGVCAPPVDGKANDALIRSLSRHLSLPQSRFSVVRGETSRSKVILVQALTKAELIRLIECSPSFEPSKS